MNDSLGDRMKRYETTSKASLLPRMPVIIRVDGKAFHTYTARCKRPFDERLSGVMVHVARCLCEEIQGAQLAYTQSDEISVLVHGYKRFTSQSWFDNELQKMVSVAAGIASSEFTAASWRIWRDDGGPIETDMNAVERVRPAAFDARAFNVPEADVCNYFLWRQQDGTRNSIQMLARSLYSHRQCENKNGNELQEMCFQKGANWNDLEVRWKRGICIRRHTVTAPVCGWRPGDPEPASRASWEPDFDVPVFSADRAYIERYLATEE